MTVKLEKKWTDYLVDQPESGMGYQKVDIWLKDNRVLKNVLVFNAQEIDLPDELATVEIAEIRLHTD